MGLVGVRQPLDPSLPVLDVANKTSRSGLFVDDIPPFKIDLLKETQDFAGISDVQFNALLTNMQKTAIANLMYKVFDTGGYIDRNYLFTNTSLRKDIETIFDNGSVMGYEIELSDKKNLGFKITRCRFEYSFDDPTLATTVYLMNTSVNTPLFSKVVTLTSNNQVETLNWVIDSTLNDYKGSYYLLIKSNDPSKRMQPYKRNYEDANEMNSVSYMEFEQVKIENFSITNFIADENENVLEIAENVGLNPDITVYDDYTDMILQNDFLFAKALQLELAIMLLMTIATSTRSNRDERKGKEIVSMIMINVNGSTNDTGVNIKGYNSNLYYEVKSVKSEIERLRSNYFGGMLKVDTVC